MSVGTLKKSGDSLKRPTRRPFGGGASESGDGDDGRNRGGDKDPFDQEYEPSYGISKVFTLFLLVVVLMTFGGLIGAYIVISTNGVLEWRPFDLPYQVFLSTLLILASSVTFIFGERTLLDREHAKSKKLFVATTVLGGVFISSQLIVWIMLVNRGLYMQSNPYAAFFYVMTVLHAVHVVGGVIALGYLLLRNWARAVSDREWTARQDLASSVGWYWHFMGGLWLVLLTLLGFWK